jgi:rod shape-determining protein MreC
VATRSRSARAAVLASSVQRSKPTPYPSKARSAVIRRTVVVVLVLLALTLLTISFRSPTTGALHDLQSAGSSALRPFQIAATRVAQPFRDAYTYVDGLTSAKSEEAKLKAEVGALRAEALANAAKARQFEALANLVHYEQGATFPRDFRAVTARVISFPSGPFTNTITIEAGSSSGLRINTPVVSGDALVGRVSNVSSHTATVTLLDDPDSFVAARDLKTGVRGGIQAGPSGTLVLNEVPKQSSVKQGDVIVTDGTHSARFPDIYPYGIPIGRVSSVGALDTATFLQVQVQPYANLGSLEAVAALVRTKSRK